MARADLDRFSSSAFTRVNATGGQLRLDTLPQIDACSHYDLRRHQKSSERPAKMMTPTSALLTKVGVSWVTYAPVRKRSKLRHVGSFGRKRPTGSYVADQSGLDGAGAGQLQRIIRGEGRS